jgi:hypothetical protein
LAWAEVPRGVAPRLVIHLTHGVDVEVHGRAPLPELRIVPVDSGGTMLRESPFVPAASDAARVVFRGLPAGRYRLVDGGVGARVGRVDRFVEFDVGAANLRVDWP